MGEEKKRETATEEVTTPPPGKEGGKEQAAAATTEPKEDGKAAALQAEIDRIRTSNRDLETRLAEAQEIKAGEAARVEADVTDALDGLEDKAMEEAVPVLVERARKQDAVIADLLEDRRQDTMTRLTGDLHEFEEGLGFERSSPQEVVALAQHAKARGFPTLVAAKKDRDFTAILEKAKQQGTVLREGQEELNKQAASESGSPTAGAAGKGGEPAYKGEIRTSAVRQGFIAPSQGKA